MKIAETKIREALESESPGKASSLILQTYRLLSTAQERETFVAVLASRASISWWRILHNTGAGHVLPASGALRLGRSGARRAARDRTPRRPRAAAVAVRTRRGRARDATAARRGRATRRLGRA